MREVVWIWISIIDWCVWSVQNPRNFAAQPGLTKISLLSLDLPRLKMVSARNECVKKTVSSKSRKIHHLVRPFSSKSSRSTRSETMAKSVECWFVHVSPIKLFYIWRWTWIRVGSEDEEGKFVHGTSRKTFFRTESSGHDFQANKSLPLLHFRSRRTRSAYGTPEFTLGSSHVIVQINRAYWVPPRLRANNTWQKICIAFLRRNILHITIYSRRRMMTSVHEVCV